MRSRRPPPTRRSSRSSCTGIGGGCSLRRQAEPSSLTKSRKWTVRSWRSARLGIGPPFRQQILQDLSASSGASGGPMTWPRNSWREPMSSRSRNCRPTRRAFKGGPSLRGTPDLTAGRIPSRCAISCSNWRGIPAWNPGAAGGCPTGPAAADRGDGPGTNQPAILDRLQGCRPTQGEKPPASRTTWHSGSRPPGSRHAIRRRVNIWQQLHRIAVPATQPVSFRVGDSQQFARVPEKRSRPGWKGCRRRVVAGVSPGGRGPTTCRRG